MIGVSVTRTWRMSLLAAVLVLPQAASARVVLPIYTDGDGTEIFDSTDLTGGLTLASGINTQGGVTFLGSCAGQRQLMIETGDDNDAHSRLINEIYQAAASAEVFTFADLAERFDYGSYTSTIMPISTDLFNCQTEDN